MVSAKKISKLVILPDFMKFGLVMLFVLAPLSFFAKPREVVAATVASYVDLTEDTTGPVDPEVVTTPAEVAVSTSDNFYFSFAKSTGNFAAAETITVTFPSGFTSLGDCDDDDADEDTTTDGSLAVDTLVATYTFSGATTTASSDGVEICVTATTPGSIGNYSVSISTTAATPDTTAALIYVTSGSGNNFVNVTATVPAVLTLDIYQPSAATLTNSCALGTLNPSAVNTCSYRVAAGTNDALGLKVMVQANDDFDDGSTNTIDDVTDNTVTAGSEEYGFRITSFGALPFVGNSSFWTTATATTSDETVPTTLSEIFDRTGTADATSSGNWVTVAHAASVNSSTVPGAYSHEVNYYVFAGV